MKSIFSILLAGVMLLSLLTGCGTKKKDAARVTPSPAVTATAQPSASARPGDMDEDVKDALDDAGEAAGDVVGGVGNAVGDVARGAGNAVEDMVDGVEDAAGGDTAAKDRNSGDTAANGGK